MRSIIFLLIISFTGVFILPLPGGSILQKIPILLLTILIVFKKELKIYREYKPVFTILIVFLLYSFLSSISFTNSLMSSSLLVAPYILLISIFLILSNLKYETLDLKLMKNLFLSIFFIQILFALIKFLILGKVDEGFLIGTMSHRAGQLSFLIPAICIPIFVFLYAKKDIKFCIFLILLALLFGFLNEKRSIVYLGPFIILASFILNNEAKKILSVRKIFPITLIFLFFSTLILQLAVFIPSLSGTEDLILTNDVSYIGFLFTYAYEYLFSDYGSALQATLGDALYDQRVQFGRITLFLRASEYFFTQDLFTQIFGFGFGSFTYNEWVFENQDRFFELTLFRGTFSGLLIILLETGYFGLYLHLHLFYIFYKSIRFNISHLKNPDFIRWSRILLVIFFIFLFDFFFYSIVLFRTLPMPLIFLIMYMSVFYVRSMDASYNVRKLN